MQARAYFQICVLI